MTNLRPPARRNCLRKSCAEVSLLSSSCTGRICPLSTSKLYKSCVGEFFAGLNSLWMTSWEMDKSSVASCRGGHLEVWQDDNWQQSTTSRQDCTHLR